MITAVVGTAIIAPKGGYNMELDKYMSTEEASKKWGVSSAWVRELCRFEKIKCIRARNMWFVEKDQPNPKKSEE